MTKSAISVCCNYIMSHFQGTVKQKIQTHKVLKIRFHNSIEPCEQADFFLLGSVFNFSSNVTSNMTKTLKWTMEKGGGA